MVQFVFSPLDESFKVAYLTNMVGSNNNISIYEIKSKVGSGDWKPGLCAEGQAVGLWDEYIETTVIDLIAKAEAIEYNLRAYQDRQIEININMAMAFFLSFTVQTNPVAVIDHEAETIAISLPNGSVVTALTPSFTTSNLATVETGGNPILSGAVEVDCTNPVDFDVISQDGTVTRTYTLTVTVLPA